MSSGVFSVLIEELDQTLADLLASERARLTAERDFLLSVLEGRGEDVTIEDPSSDVTRSYMSGSLGRYIPVEEADSGSG